MQLPQDFQEFIELALSENLKFVVVGGWAYNRYANPRMTGDIDFFIERTPESEQVLRRVLSRFGFAESLPAVWLTAVTADRSYRKQQKYRCPADRRNRWCQHRADRTAHRWA
jgi:hypothetical protein